MKIFRLWAATALLAGPACADTLGLHLVSAHDKPGFNDTNLGLYAQSDAGWTYGLVYNSERRPSAYLGMTWDRSVAPALGLALTVGGITGYHLAITPMAIPSASLRLSPRHHLRLAYLAKVRTGGAHALHLMLERRY